MLEPRDDYTTHVDRIRTITPVLVGNPVDPDVVLPKEPTWSGEDAGRRTTNKQWFSDQGQLTIAEKIQLFFNHAATSVASTIVYWIIMLMLSPLFIQIKSSTENIKMSQSVLNWITNIAGFVGGLAIVLEKWAASGSVTVWTLVQAVATFIIAYFIGKVPGGSGAASVTK